MLFRLCFLALLAPLWLGCAKDEPEKPVSGITLKAPRLLTNLADQGFVDDSSFVFEGAVLAQGGLASATVGIRYSGFAYENYEGPIGTTVEDSSFTFPVSGDLLKSVRRAIRPMSNPLPGRYKLYSQITDQGGRRSDSNIVYRYLINPAYVYMSLSQPQLSAAFTRASAGARLVVTGSVVAGPRRPDSVRFAICRFQESGALTCPAASENQSAAVVDTNSAFSGAVELPFDASPGQRFRVRVQATPDSVHYTRLLPGFEIR